MSAPMVGSLFSGYGGLDLAVCEVFGAEMAWHVEIEPAPSKILAHHYPGVPNYGDVTTCDWATMPPIDILTGGYPCQPFSAAGKRKGTDDERHLWPYVREAIRVLRPRYTLLENVAGHRSLGFDRVLGDLAEDGLDVRWTSLRASDVGAPHHRERLFILVTPADSDGIGWGEGAGQPVAGTPQIPAAVGGVGALPADRRPDDLLVLPTPRSSRGASATETMYAFGAVRDDSHRTQGEVVLPTPTVGVVLPTPRTTDSNGPGQHGTGGPDLRTAVSVLPTPNAADGGGGGRYNAAGHQSSLPGTAREVENWGKYAPAIHRWEQIVGPAPAPTEPNSNGKPRLAAAFAEWMMGLPAGWVTDPAIGISRTDQLKAIGNGVCPPQAVAGLHQLLAMEAAGA